MNAPQQGQHINLEQPQILRAAQAGLQLLNTPGAVNVPSPMAITGDVQILNALLQAIVQQQVIIVNPPAKPEGELPPPPPDENGAGEDAGKQEE